MERRGKYRVEYFALRDDNTLKMFQDWFIKKREADIIKKLNEAMEDGYTCKS